MHIKSDATVDDIEEIFKNISNTDSVITFPNTFKMLRIGVLPRLSQALITLAKNLKNPVFSFPYLRPEKPRQKEKLIEDPQCLTALLMVENVYGKDLEPLKSSMNGLLVKRFSDGRAFKKGQRTQLFAIDHSIPLYAYPLCLYQSIESGIVLSPSQFATTIREHLSSAFKLSTLSGNELSDLGTLLSELVENTDQHGKRYFNSGDSTRSVRGVVLDYRLISRDQRMEDIAGEKTPLLRYLKKLRVKNKGRIHLLEISIFDSGGGIFKSFFEDSDISSASITQEFELVQNAFKKGVTSRPNGKGYGRGLYKARRLLNDRSAYFSIRTGRLSLYRDYLNSPWRDGVEDDVELFDEKKQVSDDFTTHGLAEGLSLSILVPIR